jgi:hypothetical protein
VAAGLTVEPDVVRTRSDELAEIRWVSREEARVLTGDMADSVKRYLQRGIER